MKLKKDNKAAGSMTSENEKKITPMMRQYNSIKKSYPDTILFFRMGDFYEMFMDDAVIGSKVLGITLTSRSKSENFPLCGIPYHASETYISKLIRAGHSVTICEQFGDPKTTKGIVDRRVVRTITPGTVVNPHLLEEKENNFLVSVVFDRQKNLVGIAQLDVSTGEFLASEFSDSSDYRVLESELFRISPSEILIPTYMKAENGFWGKLAKQNWKYSFVEDTSFAIKNSTERLKKFFKTDNLSDFGCEPCAIQAAGCVLEYAQKTQQSALSHITTLQRFSPTDYMMLDEVTQRNLEITQSLVDKQKRGSLLWILDKTQTPMGGRLLKRWLLQPLRGTDAINYRLDSVEEVKNKHFLRESIRSCLEEIKDIERIFGRLALGHANPRDIHTLGNSFTGFPKVQEHLLCLESRLYKDIQKRWTNCQDIKNLIEKFIVEDPPIAAKEGGIIRSGVNTEVDKLRKIQKNGHNWIAEFERSERERTKINSLKVKFNKVFGYFIEVTRANLKNVPDDYIRKQTTVNGERYVTTKLKEMESEIISSSEKIKELEYEIFNWVREEIAKEHGKVLRATGNISTLDVIVSLAQTALENGYTRPKVHEGRTLFIKDGRHPVLEQIAEDTSFVPNDAVFREKEDRLMIITGPNMAGKSTFMRQVALIGLMAHLGSFVPAKEADIGVIDRIFTRVGASDNLLKGQSTFMVEMNETAQILKNATENSLVILDEIGRGTSTFDGLSIAWAVSEYLCENIQSKTLFATHYHELTELSSSMDGVVNYKVEAAEQNDNITFLYRVLPGGASKSYGIAVAKLAGIPDTVIKRSKSILNSLEQKYAHETNEEPKTMLHAGMTARIPVQLSLFKETSANAPKDHLIDEINRVNLDKLTPIKALNKIAQWQEKIAKL